MIDMASVTQCDICGSIIKHYESKYVRINKVTAGDGIGQELYALDACPECYTKLCMLLKVEVKK